MATEERTSRTVAEDVIRYIIGYIGDDPEREGVLETPKRVIDSYEEIFGGYGMEPVDVMKTFESDGYSQIVICRNIEFYSTCEHHMLPFYGKAHIAYISQGKVIGLSKLPRLLDIYSRRLQIQERIGEQVCDALMCFLKPRGAVCTLTAAHHCVRCRGVNKQHSDMVTSTMRGVFIDDSPFGATARAEYYALLDV